MRRRNHLPSRFTQQGYFLIIAVIFIMVMGLMGSLIAYLFATRAQLSVAQQLGLRTFYNAESGLEIGSRLLSMPALSGTPSRIGCSVVTGTAAVTNASLGGGTFTLTNVNSSPIYAVTTLSTAESASDITINVTNAASFAPEGRVMIDRELIDYADISGNTLINVRRGVNGTLASSHTSGTAVSQYQCTLDSRAGIPSIASPRYQRELQANVQLQDGWVAADVSSNNFVFSRWNRPNETSWTVSTLAGGSNAANLNAISMLSNADGWAVGDRAGSNFIFLRWNGSNWVLTTLAGSCGGQHLLGVSMVSSIQGFAVGARYRPSCAGSGNFRYTILRWNGSTWSLLTPSTSPSIPADASTHQDLNAVHVIDTDGDGLGNIGFAVGNSGRILQYNGTNWVNSTSPTTQDLNGVFTVSSSEAWAVGAGGVILRWNGSAWSAQSSPTTTELNAIAMLDTNGDGIAELGWAVGNSERIASYNGSSWSLTDLGGDTLLGVAIFNAKDVWAVGAAGVATHWNGTSWETISSGTTRPINGISVVSPRQNPVSTWRQIFR